VDLGEEGDVLVDGQVAIETEALRQVADAAGDGAVLASRIAVVFPAPSGPISPNISPRPTSKLTPSSARVAP
jgi:hypothetical protein